MPCQPSNDTPVIANDSSTLASQHDDRNRSRKQEKWRHKCDHYGKFGHKIDWCYALHGRPPQSAIIAQTYPPSKPSIIETTRTLLIHVRFLNLFGVMLFLLHVILLIICLLQF